MHALIAVAMVQASATAFSPPLDRPIAYTMVETRTDDRGTQSFAIDRRVTFSRRPGGFVAVVETVRVDGGAAGGPGKIFQAAVGDTVGRPVRILLDDQGRLVDVPDRDAEWSRQMDALDRAVAGGSAARQATGAALTAPLRALDGPAKAKRIAEAVDAVIAGTLLHRGPFATRPVTTTGSGPAGAVALSGTESAQRAADGGLLYERRMTGEAMDLVDTRRIRRDGLVAEAIETRTIRVGGRVQTIVRRTTLTL